MRPITTFVRHNSIKAILAAEKGLKAVSNGKIGKNLFDIEPKFIGTDVRIIKVVAKAGKVTAQIKQGLVAQVVCFAGSCNDTLEVLLSQSINAYASNDRRNVIFVAIGNIVGVSRFQGLVL